MMSPDIFGLRGGRFHFILAIFHLVLLLYIFHGLGVKGHLRPQATEATGGGIGCAKGLHTAQIYHDLSTT